MSAWQPSLGAWFDDEEVHFRVWAPDAASVRLRLQSPSPVRSIPMTREFQGYFTQRIGGLEPGDRYWYMVDDHGPFPDPASRWQPDGVHGPSALVDPSRYSWNDASYSGIDRDDLVIYELHVGTFTPDGTFASAIEHLPYLRDLGITAIELMPLADFPGRRNWGYDGVDLFAPARCYGPPDDLRRFVDHAHQLGLAVLLDIVYNHLGPEGNYLSRFSRSYYSETKHTLWGPAINLDGPRSRPVREFLIENALQWVHEYHFDGFRLDATHHLFDDSPRHLLAELSSKVRASVPDRPIHLIAEDPRNLASIVQPESSGGWGFDGVWSDDFHHNLRRYLVGDDEGVFVDFRGSLDDLATTINRGWLFQGAYSQYRGYHRGTDPSGLDPRRFIFCIQNHDRIGNRAQGERLHHQIDLATYRAVSALLLVCPCTPLLFMGQEWAASTPFLYFTDHPEALGEKVRVGRQQEFRHYRAFSDPARSALIPDCQAESTFRACKLLWPEREQEPHISIERFYRAWLGLRTTEPALREHSHGSHFAQAIGLNTIAVRRTTTVGSSLLFIAHLHDSGQVDLTEIPWLSDVASAPWKTVLSTEEPGFDPTPCPPRVENDGQLLVFDRPSGILMRLGSQTDSPPPSQVSSDACP